MFSCVYMYILCCFFKQKTAYDMRISDWSSDVFSSELKPLDNVADLFSAENLRAIGLFDVEATTRLFAKARAGRVVGFADNQAFVGVLSTLLLLRQRPGAGIG